MAVIVSVLQYVQAAFSSRGPGVPAKRSDEVINSLLWISFVTAGATAAGFTDNTVGHLLEQVGEEMKKKLSTAQRLRIVIRFGALCVSMLLIMVSLLTFHVGLLVFLYADQPASVAVSVTVVLVTAWGALGLRKL